MRSHPAAMNAAGERAVFVLQEQSRALFGASNSVHAILRALRLSYEVVNAWAGNIGFSCVPRFLSFAGLIHDTANHRGQIDGSDGMEWKGINFTSKAI